MYVLKANCVDVDYVEFRINHVRFVINLTVHKSGIHIPLLKLNYFYSFMTNSF